MTRLTRHIRETLAEVAAAAADAEAFCAAAGADESQCLRIGLAVDELAANALIHGAERETAPDIRVEVWSDEAMLHLKLSARGPRFDPREHRAAGEADAYSLGGRGLNLVLAFADQLSYVREERLNVTTFSVSKRAKPEPGDDGARSSVADGGNEA